MDLENGCSLTGTNCEEMQHNEKEVLSNINLNKTLQKVVVQELNERIKKSISFQKGGYVNRKKNTIPGIGFSFSL